MVIELTAATLQTVEENNSIAFTDGSGFCCRNSAIHRDGSGFVSLRARGQGTARYKASFGANVQLPTAGTLDDPIRVALSINGEPINYSIMISTPAAVEEFDNIFTSVIIEVPCGCCYQISVQNLSGQSIEVQNANLIIERVA